MGTEDESFQKAILISDSPADALSRHMAQLPLPRRALSLPATEDVSDLMPNLVELWGEIEPLRRVLADWPHPSRAWLVREVIPMAYERT